VTTTPIQDHAVLQPVAPKTTAAATAVPSDASPAFRILLDSLDRLVQAQPRAPEVQSADDLKTAIDDTDKGFQQAMDLRRRLEDAFRARLT